MAFVYLNSAIIIKKHNNYYYHKKVNSSFTRKVRNCSCAFVAACIKTSKIRRYTT